MIHRQNWLDVRAYLDHIERVRQNDPSTVKRARGQLRHLLEWADATPFPKARHIDLTFPAYLLHARADGKAKTLAPGSITKCLANARQFFDFARLEWTLRYKPISVSWIELLQPPRAVRMDSRLPVREFWSLTDVLKVAAVSTETLREARAQVAVCMLFLSGMRAEALASLPIACVDLSHGALRQLPEAGVRTKNRKAAITYLLNIPEVWAVVQAWHDRVTQLSPTALWYATLSRDGMVITATLRAYEGRHNTVQRDIKLICQKAQVPYLSPHKLRHGHIMYARNLAHSLEEFKAISQNVMHSSMLITDQVYSVLMNNQVENVISKLGTQSSLPQKDIQRLIELLQNQLN